MCGFVKYASDSLVTMPNQRAVRHSREALQIATKPRLGWSGSPTAWNRNAARSLIGCYENFF